MEKKRNRFSIPADFLNKSNIKYIKTASLIGKIESIKLFRKIFKTRYDELVQAFRDVEHLDSLEKETLRIMLYDSPKEEKKPCAPLQEKSCELPCEQSRTLPKVPLYIGTTDMTQTIPITISYASAQESSEKSAEESTRSDMELVAFPSNMESPEVLPTTINVLSQNKFATIDSTVKLPESQTDCPF